MGEPNLVPLSRYPGRADRYYAGLGGIVAVEVTRLVEPDKERAEREPHKLLMHDIAPLLEGRVPGKYFAMIHPPWNVPPVGSARRLQLAQTVADAIRSIAPVTTAERMSEVRLGDDVHLHLIRGSARDGRGEVVYGGMSSLYGGFEGELRRAAQLRIEHAISNKAGKRQVEGTEITRRVLLLHDLMGGAEPDVLDAVVTSLPVAGRAFDEIAVVPMFDSPACYRLSLN